MAGARDIPTSQIRRATMLIVSIKRK